MRLTPQNYAANPAPGPPPSSWPSRLSGAAPLVLSGFSRGGAELEWLVTQPRSAMTRTPPPQGLEGLLRQKVDEGGFEIPPLPRTASQVLLLAADASASPSDLARLVHQDVGLASRVLRQANSSALGGAVPIVSIGQALARLGMRRVSEIALAASLRDGLFAVERHASLANELWRRSLATALFAKEVAREARENVEVAFLCGLVWRVGRIVVLHVIVELAEEEGGSFQDVPCTLERFDRDFTRAAVGSWELPAIVAQAVGSTDGGLGSSEASLIRVAERLADLALGGVEDAQELVGDPDAKRLNLYANAIEDLYEKRDLIETELGELA